jgi:hypothetical protein
MSGKTDVDRVALDACKARIQDIVREVSGDDAIHAAFMVGLIVGQADRWVSHGAPNTAAERLSEAERYLGKAKSAAAREGIRL